MSGIVQGIPSGIQPSPQLGDKAIPVEATGKRELRVTDFDEQQQSERLADIMLACLNELMILNNTMFPNVKFDSERTGFAYEELNRNRR